jgi:hypothetical protein
LNFGGFFSRNAEKQLLGKLHEDQKYLQSLITNPLLNKTYPITPGEEPVLSVTVIKV